MCERAIVERFQVVPTHALQLSVQYTVLMHPDRRTVNLDEIPGPIPTPLANETRADGAQSLNTKQNASNEKPDSKAYLKPPPTPPPHLQPTVKKKSPPVIERAQLQWHKAGAKKPVKLPYCELLADGTFCGYSDKKGTQALCCFCCGHAVHCTSSLYSY